MTSKTTVGAVAKRAIVGALSCLLLSHIAGGLALVQAQGDTEHVEEKLSRFEAQDWHARQGAFYELLDVVVPGGLHGRTDLIPSALDKFLKERPERKEQVAAAVIGLLGRENDIVRNATAGSLSEEFVNYLGDLIGAAAALRDPRAADALINNLRTGNMASKAVAAFGAESIDRVLAVLDSGDIAARIGATRTLGQMLDPAIAKIDAASRAKVKAGLLHAARDEFFAVRDSAVSGLVRLPNADVTAALKLMAEQDPYSRSGEAGQLVYPVRDAARKALASRPAQ